MPPERLDKLLASTGRWSRRQVKDLIRQGRVRLNGAAVTRPEEKWDPDLGVLTVDQEAILCPNYVYLMMNKPAGLLSATKDPRQPTVLQLLPPYLQQRQLFPVGRLDKDTEGLLLFTDDGPLAHRLLSPRSHVNKVYTAVVDKALTSEDVLAFQQGVVLKDGYTCRPAQLLPLEDGHRCEITLQEGKYHQIKRMMAALGKSVLYLKRVSMGSLPLDPVLKLGEWRFLTQDEGALLHSSSSSG